MPTKEQAFAWLAEHSPLIYSVCLSVIVAVLRVTYTGGTTRQKWLEGLMCGFMTLTVVSGFSIFGLPMDAAAFAGGMLGFIGVEQTRSLAVRFLGNKIDRGGA